MKDHIRARRFCYGCGKFGDELKLPLPEPGQDCLDWVEATKSAIPAVRDGTNCKTCGHVTGLVPHSEDRDLVPA